VQEWLCGYWKRLSSGVFLLRMTMKDSERPLGDWIAVVTLVLNAALLCLVVYQGVVTGQAAEAIVYLREHCIIK